MNPCPDNLDKCDDEGRRAVESEDIPKTVSAHDLFAGAREICIEHEGERYRLRITRRGKLILQK